MFNKKDTINTFKTAAALLAAKATCDTVTDSNTIRDAVKDHTESTTKLLQQCSSDSASCQQFEGAMVNYQEEHLRNETPEDYKEYQDVYAMYFRDEVNWSAREFLGVDSSMGDHQRIIFPQCKRDQDGFIQAQNDEIALLNLRKAIASCGQSPDNLPAQARLFVDTVGDEINYRGVQPANRVAYDIKDTIHQHPALGALAYGAELLTVAFGLNYLTTHA